MRLVVLNILKALMIVGVVIALLALLAYPSQHSSQQVKDKLESLADKIRPGAGWKQDSNREIGTFLCSGAGGPCGSLNRTWVPDHHVSPEEFPALVRSTGWDIKANHNCTPPQPSPGLYELCEASGSVDSHYVRISLVMTGNNDEVFLNAMIQKQNLSP